jgi:hypothetical protein
MTAIHSSCRLGLSVRVPGIVAGCAAQRTIELFSLAAGSHRAVAAGEQIYDQHCQSNYQQYVNETSSHMQTDPRSHRIRRITNALHSMVIILQLLP